MGKINDFLVRKRSEKNFDPEGVDFEELESEVEDTLRGWGVPLDSPRSIEYHDGIMYDPRGEPFQAQLKPWLDRIDVSLRQHFSVGDLMVSLFEEELHKSQFDYFMGHPGSEFDETAATLEDNFQEYWEKIETEIDSGLTGSARERTIEGTQDMKIAALPEIGVDYEDIIEEAQDSRLYRLQKPRALRKTMKQKLDDNEDELLEVAAPLKNRLDSYTDIYHVNPVAEAFADLMESHLTGRVGSKTEKWFQRLNSRNYQLGTDPDLYQTLVNEYQGFEGTEEEKISHVMGLMPEYLEEQYENGELPENMQPQDVRKF